MSAFLPVNVAQRVLFQAMLVQLNKGSDHRNTRPHLAHLSPAEYSAVFAPRKVVCDVTRSVASHLAEYSAAVRTGPSVLCDHSIGYSGKYVSCCY